MVLFTILLIVLAVLTILALLSVFIAGGLGIVTFGDLIVYILIIYGIVKLIKKFKKK
jgi:hypothetical protein